MASPSVGIIVPCFNQARYAADCVASIEAQTFFNWRAIVIDDASTDGSGELLDSLATERVTVVHLAENLGRARVRNEGLRRLGDVDYVLNVDCDDAIGPDYVERLVDALEQRSDAGLAYGTLVYFGLPHVSGRATWPPNEYVHAERYLTNVIPGAGTMFRSAALRQTDGWRKEFTEWGSEDYDLWLQVVEREWAVVWVREAVYDYRQHTESFLAKTDAWQRITAWLALLRFHHRSMRREGAVIAFLSPLVLPSLYRELRSGHLARALRILVPLMRFAPRETLAHMWDYYIGRARDRRRG